MSAESRERADRQTDGRERDDQQLVGRPTMQRTARSAAGLRRAGSAMISIGVIGVVVALAGTVVAWGLLGELNSSTGETLDVTLATIDSVEDSIDLADQVLVATTESIDTAASTLEALEASLGAGTGVVEEIEQLTATVGPALSDAVVTLRQLEEVGATIDGLLDDLSSIPFAPAYQPERGLGESIGAVADEIEKLPVEFDETATEVRRFRMSLEEVRRQIATLASDIDSINNGLTETDPVIADYRRNIADARAIAVGSRDDLDVSVALMRLFVVLGGLVFAAGQFVPFWVGRELVERSALARQQAESGPQRSTEAST